MQILIPKHLEVQAIQLMRTIEIEKLSLKPLCETINQTMDINKHTKARQAINYKLSIIARLENQFDSILNTIPGEKLLDLFV